MHKQRPKRKVRLIFEYEGERVSWREWDIIVRGEEITYVKPHDVILPFEIFNEIVEHISCGKTFKSILTACKKNSNIYKTIIPRYCNHLWTLINHDTPRKYLYWDSIMSNPNTDSKHIDEFVRTFKKVSVYCGNSKKGPKLTILLPKIFDNPNINVNHLNKIHEKYKKIGENRYYYSKSPNITMGDIEANPHLEWDWFAVCMNPNFEFEFVLRKPHYDWPWYAVSRSRTLKMEDVENNLHLPWDARQLLNHPNFTEEFVTTYFPDVVGVNPLLKGINRHTPLEIIEEYLLSQQDVDSIAMWDVSANKNITIDLVLKYPNLKWKWNVLSANSAITLQDIENNPKLPWDWDNVCSNNNLTAQYVMKHPDVMCNWYSICMNKFDTIY